MNKISTPEGILPDGDDFTLVVNPFSGSSGNARKGTVAATLNNIALLNKSLSNAESDQNNEIKKAISSLIPSLKAVGIFDLFGIEEWINDTQQLGRIYVAVLYLKQYPNEITSGMKLKLQKIANSTQSVYLRNEIETLRLTGLK